MQGGDPGDAGAALGPGRRDHLARRTSADGQPDPLEHGPRGGDRLLEDVAREVAVDGVTVNSVQPGIHATARMTALYGDDPAAATVGIPAGVTGDPGDFGQIVAFLCSEQARFVTGAAVNVDGGANAAVM